MQRVTRSRSRSRLPNVGKVTRNKGLSKHPNVILPPGAKYGKSKLVKGPTIHRWEAFRDEIMKTPVYFINCHGSICSSYLKCGEGNKRKMTAEEDAIGIPSFQIPKSTYILSVTSGDEYCLVGDRLINDITVGIDNFRKILLVNDRKTDVREMKNMEPDEHSLISSLYRATECWYPNIGCSFLDDDLDTKTEYAKKRKAVDLTADEKLSGVFALDTIPFISKQTRNNGTLRSVDNPTQSMIRIATYGERGRMGPYKNGMWYLDDIIKHVYETTGIHKGIFVFAGCTSHYSPSSEEWDKDITTCQRLIYDADIAYGTTKPTLDADQLIKAGHKSNIPISVPTKVAFSSYTPYGVRANLNAGIIEKIDARRLTPDNISKVVANLGPGVIEYEK